MRQAAAFPNALIQTLCVDWDSCTTLTEFRRMQTSIGRLPSEDRLRKRGEALALRELGEAPDKSTLTTLHLCGCGITPGAAHLAEGMRKSASLTTLSLFGNKIGNSGAPALGFTLAVTSTIKTLELRDCGITAAGAAHLAEGVGKSASLAMLILEFNNLGDSGAQALDSALAATSTLTNLDLLYCGITAAGAAHLAEGVGKSASLATLNLFNNNPLGNKIGDSGAQALGVALAATSTLTSLNLSYCGITAAGAAHLAEGVGKSASLETLNLLCNNLGNSGAQALGAELAATSTLALLDRCFCGITAAGAAHLAEGKRQGPPRRVPLTLYRVDPGSVAAQVGLGYTAGGWDTDKDTDNVLAGTGGLGPECAEAAGAGGGGAGGGEGGGGSAEGREAALGRELEVVKRERDAASFEPLAPGAAVALECGHIYCNRQACASSSVTAYPECLQPIGARVPLYGVLANACGLLPRDA
jgi:hypothetical protein